MPDTPDLREVISEALEHTWGLALTSNDPEKLRAALYREARLLEVELHITVKPGEVWLRRRPPGGSSYGPTGPRSETDPSP